MEFGQQRSNCCCKLCVSNCKNIPGYLLPSDLDRMLVRLKPPSQTINEWVEQNLLASSGATARINGIVMKIATLVPARNLSTNFCKFLSNDRCKIHEISPFGCAFFDAHNVAAKLSLEGIKVVHEEWQKESGTSLYVESWHHLASLNLYAPPPEILRERRRNSKNQK